SSGKETFVKHIVNDNPADLIEDLGWEDKTVVASNDSLELIDGHLGETRDQVLDGIPSLLANNDVVLIKWQHVDSGARRPQRLKEVIPDAKHRIIELKVSMGELVLRLPRKHWWHDLGRERNHLNGELEMLAASLDALPDFDRTVVDSSSTSYRVTT
ncbi:hypothetical protein HY857_00230, partial [Candidatus Saccharibacteria bacterium]|nr:hypothetical protein [Candidatus Saccharibacteria bacterium]